MLWSEIANLEDCEQCPLLKEEICNSGFTSSPSGTPVEPPCCCFDDDTDLDTWILDYYERQRRFEEYCDRQYRNEQEKRRKADVAKRKREFLKRYCVCELTEVNRIKKHIKSLEKSISFAESLVFAFNVTNEMFRYNERKQVDSKAYEQLNKLKEELKSAEENLKAKQKEGRKTDKYKEIVLMGL